jgi:hypothetical protein
MKKAIYILFISNYVFAQTATLDTNTILIGQQINFTISNQISSTEIWPSYDDFLADGVEIIKALEIDTTNEMISQQFIITAWDSGSYYIPSIIFSENHKTEVLLINVQTLVLAKDTELKDIKKPINEPIGWSDIWPWLLAISILILIIFLIKKYLFTKKEIEKTVRPKVIIDAHIVALKQLTKLEKKKMWQEGNIKEYQSQLSEIIRRYTENRFKFIALELTTDEILKKLQSILSTKQLNTLRTLLERADLAKFAKSKPVDTENKESMDLAQQFIKSTKEREENE